MTRIQQPSVAGVFYPAEPSTLANEINQMLSKVPEHDGRVPKALIVPHAGYVYSGPVAASAYARLISAGKKIHRVVAMAPAHRVPFRGLAVSSAEYFRTPLGDLPVDLAAVGRALKFSQVQQFDTAFQGEHALEVHLPFLQQVLSSFQLVPFIVGDATAEEVSEVLEDLWGGEETLILISSDLSHYLDYDAARARDRNTTRAIEALAPQQIDFHDACGRIPVCGLLLSAKDHHLNVDTVDLRNSGDTAGSKDRVVGYGAYTFHQ